MASRGTQARPPPAYRNDDAEQDEDPEEMDPRNFPRYRAHPPPRRSVTYDGITILGRARVNVGDVGEKTTDTTDKTYKNISADDDTVVNFGDMTEAAYRDFSRRPEPTAQAAPPRAEPQEPPTDRNASFRPSVFPNNPNPNYGNRPVPASGMSAQQWAASGHHGLPTAQMDRTNSFPAQPALSDSGYLSGDGSNATLFDRSAQGRSESTINISQGFHHLSSNRFSRPAPKLQDR